MPDRALGEFLAGVAAATARRPGEFLAALAAAVAGDGAVTVDLDGQELAVVLGVLTAGTLAGGWWLAQGHAGSASELFRRAATACGPESWTV